MYSIMELLMGCLQHDKFVVVDTATVVSRNLY